MVPADDNSPGGVGASARHTSQGVCKNVVHEDLSISAKIDIDPIVNVGPIITHCLGKAEIIPVKDKCPCGGCSFIVHQHLCVEVPIDFGTCTSANPLGMVCNGADAGPCKCPR